MRGYPGSLLMGVSAVQREGASRVSGQTPSWLCQGILTCSVPSSGLMGQCPSPSVPPDLDLLGHNGVAWSGYPSLSVSVCLCESRGKSPVWELAAVRDLAGTEDLRAPCRSCDSPLFLSLLLVTVTAIALGSTFVFATSANQ